MLYEVITRIELSFKAHFPEAFQDRVGKFPQVRRCSYQGYAFRLEEKVNAFFAFTVVLGMGHSWQFARNNFV